MHRHAIRIGRTWLALLAALLLFGCGGSSSSGGGSSTACEGAAIASSDICTAWMLNTTAETAAIVGDKTTGVKAEVNTQSVTANGTETYVTVTATGTPNYTITLSAADIAAFDAEYATELPGGTSAPADTALDWGYDMGFTPGGGTLTCKTTMGATGWWPPLSQCYSTQSVSAEFAVSPVATSDTCYSREATMGLYVNGTAIFNWSDGRSYNDAGIWHTVAAKLESHGQDLCDGHSNASGTYHHHYNPGCLEQQLNDDGSGHSPIYGYMADGFPIHGRWYASGQEALPSWVTRDYDTPGTYGCSTSGVRDCTLDDQFAPTPGGKTTVTAGPTTAGTVTGADLTTYTATSGVFFEDYYYNASLYGSQPWYLDKHNGHDHDSLGYHYHVTSTFPYNVGPTFAGQLPSSGGLVNTCYSTPTM